MRLPRHHRLSPFPGSGREPVAGHGVQRGGQPRNAHDWPLVGFRQGHAPVLSAATVLALQRAAGNTAVVSMLTGHLPVQRQSCCASCADGHSCQSEEKEELAASPPTSSPAVQRTMGDGHDLTSPRFAGDQILEACFDDEARLGKGATGPSVTTVQQALIEEGYDLGASGADGIYGTRTWNAVKQFKADERLGYEYMGDVGPGTMGRLDALFAGGGVQPVSPITPVGPEVPGELPVCAGTETAEEEESVGGGSTTASRSDDTSGVGRRPSFAFVPPPPSPYCPVPGNYSMFSGQPPANSPRAAHVLPAFFHDRSGDFIKVVLVGNHSWVNRDVVPEGIQVPKKILWIERYVNECLLHFSKKSTPFPAEPPPGCPAAQATVKSHTAKSGPQCTSVIRDQFYTELATDGNTRLLHHEQYHMKLACALAEIANERVALAVARGVDKYVAIQNELDRVRLTNKDLQENRYDPDSANGCNGGGQAAWEAAIDTPGGLKLAYG